MRKLDVLVACEYSGIVRNEFRKLGHEAISCDLLPTETQGPHVVGDVLPLLKERWDLIIAHPPCTYMANSGVRWLYNSDGTTDTKRWFNLIEAMEFFNTIKNAHCPHIAIENPIPHKYAVNGIADKKGIGKYTQTIQPYEFGHTTSKRTCLWLKNLPKLQPTKIIPKEERTQDVWLASPGPERWRERSRTFQGIAEAMAKQWSEHILYGAS